MEEVRVFLDLGESSREYSFSIDWRSDPPILHIPGNHRGPDVCIPQREEQVAWLNGLDKMMTPYWDCQWKFIRRSSVGKFIELMKGMENGKER